MVTPPPRPLRYNAHVLQESSEAAGAGHPGAHAVREAGRKGENEGGCSDESATGAAESVPGGAADDAVAAVSRADTGQKRFTGLPGASDRLVAPILDHLAVNAVGGAAKGEFA